MRQISLLILQPNPKVGGGVVEYLNTLVKYLPDNIVTTKFIVGSNVAIGDRETSSNPVSNAGRTLHSAVMLLLLLRRKRYDAVMVNPSFNRKSLLRDGLYVLISRIFGAKLVYVQFHGWEHKLSEKVIGNPLYKWCFRITFGRADQIGVLARSIEKSLLLLGIDSAKIVSSPAFFDEDIYQYRSKKPNSGLQLLFLSRFIKEKGVHNLVEAFSCIAREEPELRLVMAGDGPELETVRNWVLASPVADQITFPGYVVGKEKYDLLWKSHAFVLPSDTEGCPVSMLEAMAAGCAVIATPVGSIPEIVIPDVNGWLVADNSSESIEQGLRRLVDCKADLSEISSKNRDCARNRYSASINVNAFADRLLRQT